MSNPLIRLTIEIARNRLSYDPLSGELRWVASSGRRVKAGSIAGCLSKSNRQGLSYRRVRVDGNDYHAHRVAVLLMTGSWPGGHVDHIDGNGLNNKWENLRVVTIGDNSRNQSRHKRNQSGVMGVSWRPLSNRWSARIVSNGVQYNLGSFGTKNEAIHARKKAESKHGFHANHGREKHLT